MERIRIKSPFPKKDQYLEKAMHDEIAYCRLIRKTIRGKVKYYLQLVMKGIPPQKREVTEGEVGLDIGISTCGGLR